MAIDLVKAPTGGAPLGDADYDAQNNYIQAAIYALMSKQLHLTRWDNLLEPKIKQGVYIPHGGALFVVNSANEEITDPGGLANGRWYIKVERTGDILEAEFTDSAAGYSWDYTYCGFYHADGSQLLPYILYYTAAGDYYKFDLRKIDDIFDITSDLWIEEIYDIGDWNMTAVGLKTVAHTMLEWKNLREIDVIIRNDADTSHSSLWKFRNTADPQMLSGGAYTISSNQFELDKRTGGLFDTIEYNDTSYNRGWIYVKYFI
jgi:hypothetical protein